MELSYIYQELQSLGITANYKGYKQLALAVQLALQKEERLNHAAKALYQPVADQLGCSCSSVERNIRTAARVAWQINPCGLQKLAGYPLCAAPSAAAFVSILTTHLLRQQMEKTSR